ncbi:lipopolysaccharide-induced tumor necrosis factor-alpha factor homolog [Cylas formicarius]|uniref:lipopolysaccharide-induced tumor necrosis factor-alpha factor homolog n=1 Tax=Cylas formicarius TaxID=197179 RepID=UPI002958AA59|nr:lipopolysaccharide-induced tumor necrosis factor-alpha factor homolog [Cylas formicarius]
METKGRRPPSPGQQSASYQPPPVTIQPQSAGPQVAAFGPKPAQTRCPSCHAEIVTKIVNKANTKTHAIALLMCCCVCCLCAWLPYVLDTCQSQQHFCPECGTYLGTHSN